MTTTTPAEAAAAADLGTASARKSGRNPTWPYVPVILHDVTDGPGGRFIRTRQEQILKRAFATRDEAVACAEAVIARRRASLEAKLAKPNMRALRAQHGVA